MKPLCFVLMPFGRKTDASGRLVDFDAVYAQIIAPAVEAAGLEAIRADEEKVGGTIHKPMFERLMLCAYAVADLTGANANVYYELGIRHATRPSTTVIVFAEGTTLPFDLALVRGLNYRLDSSGKPATAEWCSQKLTEALTHTMQAQHRETVDSPLFQLVEGMTAVQVDHNKTDIFRHVAEYSKDYKERLAAAREGGLDAVKAIAASPDLQDLSHVESAVIIDMFLAFRDVRGYQDMVDLYARMPKPLQQARMVQEQYGFALNRLGKSADAERVLKGVIDRSGASSETNGLLGRVYKDRYDAAKAAGDSLRSRGFLNAAIDTYLKGFEADWRDPYPGVNAVMLMEMQDKVDPRQAKILPVVRFSADLRARIDDDYWSYITLFELAVLGRDVDEAENAVQQALSRPHQSWYLETTAGSLRRICAAREKRDEDVGWIANLEAYLRQEQERLEARTKETAG
jgi:hypothetical protein